MSAVHKNIMQKIHVFSPQIFLSVEYLLENNWKRKSDVQEALRPLSDVENPSFATSGCF